MIRRLKYLISLILLGYFTLHSFTPYLPTPNTFLSPELISQKIDLVLTAGGIYEGYNGYQGPIHKDAMYRVFIQSLRKHAIKLYSSSDPMLHKRGIFLLSLIHKEISNESREKQNKIYSLWENLSEQKTIENNDKWNIVVPTLFEMIKRKKWDIRITAIRYISYLKDKTLLCKVTQLLQDPNRDVRIAAANALSLVDLENSTTWEQCKKLFDIFENNFIPTLESIPNSLIIVPALLGLYTYSPLEIQEKSLIIRKLHAIGEFSLICILHDLQSKKRKAKISAIELLGFLGSQKHASLLHKFLWDQNVQIKIATAKTLRLLKSHDSIFPLRDVLYDNIQEVRYEIATALSQIDHNSKELWSNIAKINAPYPHIQLDGLKKLEIQDHHTQIIIPILDLLIQNKYNDVIKKNLIKTKERLQELSEMEEDDDFLMITNTSVEIITTDQTQIKKDQIIPLLDSVKFQLNLADLKSELWGKRFSAALSLSESELSTPQLHILIPLLIEHLEDGSELDTVYEALLNLLMDLYNNSEPSDNIHIFIPSIINALTKSTERKDLFGTTNEYIVYCIKTLKQVSTKIDKMIEQDNNPLNILTNRFLEAKDNSEKRKSLVEELLTIGSNNSTRLISVYEMLISFETSYSIKKLFLRNLYQLSLQNTLLKDKSISLLKQLLINEQNLPFLVLSTHYLTILDVDNQESWKLWENLFLRIKKEEQKKKKDTTSATPLLDHWGKTQIALSSATIDWNDYIVSFYQQILSLKNISHKDIVFITQTLSHIDKHNPVWHLLYYIFDTKDKKTEDLFQAIQKIVQLFKDKKIDVNLLPYLIDFLHTIIKNDKQNIKVHPLCIQAISLIDKEKSIPLYKDLFLNNTNTTIRKAALQAIIANTSGKEKEIYTCLFRLLFYLTTWKIPNSIQVLLNSQQHVDKNIYPFLTNILITFLTFDDDIQELSIKALGFFGDFSSLEMLRQILILKPATQIKEAIHTSIGQIKIRFPQKVVDQAIEDLNTQTTPIKILFALQNLKRIKGNKDAAIPKVQELLDHPNHNIKQEARQVYQDIQQKKAPTQQPKNRIQNTLAINQSL